MEPQLDRSTNGANAIVLECDAHRATSVTGPVEHVLGYTADQWLADPDFWKSHLHTSDRDRVANERKMSVRQGRDHTLTYRMIGAGGRTVWLHDTATILNRKGGAAGLRSTSPPDPTATI